MPEFVSPKLGVHAWASVAADEVDERHLAIFGKGFRRIGSYAKLAQVGAHTCLKAADADLMAGSRVGIFLGTGLGNTETAVPMTEGILHAERPWCSPMAFAGSVGNAASYYVARTLDLAGMNVTVSQEELSFETALMEAVLAISAGFIELALIGGVDVYTDRREEHRARLDAVGVLGVPTGGSGWLLLGRAPARVTLEEVWTGFVDVSTDLFGGVGPGDTLLPGWRLHDSSNAETRLMSVAAALRLVETIEAAVSGPPTGATRQFTHVHRTRRGFGARVRVSIA